jgi:hypothetical protein
MTSKRGGVRYGTVQTAFGANGVGACSVMFAVRGDIVVGVYNIATGASASSSFESTVTVTGQVQQSSSANNSANEYDFFIQPVLSSPQNVTAFVLDRSLLDGPDVLS